MTLTTGSSADLRSNVETDDRVLGEFRRVALALPNISASADVDEGFG